MTNCRRQAAHFQPLHRVNSFALRMIERGQLLPDFFIKMTIFYTIFYLYRILNDAERAIVF